jgi:hypothetical protein
LLKYKIFLILQQHKDAEIQPKGDNLMTMATPKLWSANALATELRLNARTVARMLIGVEPDGQLHGRDAWHLDSAVRALGEYQRRSDRLNGRRVIGSTGNGTSDPVLGEIEQVAHTVDLGMDQLRRTPAGPERLKVLAGFGREIGRLDRLMQQANARKGADAALVLSGFSDRTMAALVTEITGLLNPPPA